MFGIFPVGVTVTVKLAGVPAGSVKVAGDTEIAKSLTVATAGGGAGVTTTGVPKTVTLPPSLNEPATVGVRMTVTVATAPPFNVPTVQVTVPPDAGQLVWPGELAAETKVAPLAGRTSVKMIPVVRSPLLVIL